MPASSAIERLAAAMARAFPVRRRDGSSMTEGSARVILAADPTIAADLEEAGSLRARVTELEGERDALRERLREHGWADPDEGS